jgi:hypothetical protein
LAAEKKSSKEVGGQKVRFGSGCKFFSDPHHGSRRTLVFIYFFISLGRAETWSIASHLYGELKMPSQTMKLSQQSN